MIGESGIREALHVLLILVFVLLRADWRAQ
jgi:hypothetical protein